MAARVAARLRSRSPIFSVIALSDTKCIFAPNQAPCKIPWAGKDGAVGRRAGLGMRSRGGEGVRGWGGRAVGVCGAEKEGPWQGCAGLGRKG